LIKIVSDEERSSEEDGAPVEDQMRPPAQVRRAALKSETSSFLGQDVGYSPVLNGQMSSTGVSPMATSGGIRRRSTVDVLADLFEQQRQLQKS